MKPFVVDAVTIFPEMFSAVTDFAYIGRERVGVISSVEGGRFAIPAARSSRQLPFRYGPAADVPVEMRGAGSCSGIGAGSSPRAGR